MKINHKKNRNIYFYSRMTKVNTSGKWFKKKKNEDKKEMLVKNHLQEKLLRIFKIPGL